MVTIPAQFNGPDRSANGGYACGLLAEALGHAGPVTSTLQLPPPLDTPLAWERSGPVMRLVTHGGATVGTAEPGSFAADPPPYATTAEVQAGATSYPGYHHHPFGRCFTCGTAREPGEALRIFSGPVGPDRTAGPWDAHPNLVDGNDHPAAIVWAALDCPGGWAADFTKQPMVLGRMTAQVFGPVPSGVRYHVSGRLDGRDGRKSFTSTALHTTTGTLLGRAEQVWIEAALDEFD